MCVGGGALLYSEVQPEQVSTCQDFTVGGGGRGEGLEPCLGGRGAEGVLWDRSSLNV